MYNSYRAFDCKYVKKWEDLTKNDLSLGWLKWGTFDLLELIFLHAQLEKASSKIKQNEWEAYFD